MRIKRPHLIFDGIQIKSEECFHRFARAVQEIEEQAGIHSTRLTLTDIFFCPWIDIEKCKKTYTERVLIEIIEKMNIKKA